MHSTFCRSEAKDGNHNKHVITKKITTSSAISSVISVFFFLMRALIRRNRLIDIDREFLLNQNNLNCFHIASAILHNLHSKDSLDL